MALTSPYVDAESSDGRGADMNRELVTKVATARKRMMAIRKDMAEVRKMKRGLQQYAALDVIQSAIGELQLDVCRIRDDIRPVAVGDNPRKKFGAW